MILMFPLRPKIRGPLVLNNTVLTLVINQNKVIRSTHTLVFRVSGISGFAKSKSCYVVIGRRFFLFEL